MKKVIILSGMAFLSMSTSAQHDSLTPQMNGELFASVPLLIKSGIPDLSKIAKKSFLDREDMDTNVKPGENFFMYASGNWMKRTEIPAAESAWGSFPALDHENKNSIKRVLDEVAAKDNPKGGVAQKVADFYRSGMAIDQIERLDYIPVKFTLNKIDAVSNQKELLELAATLYKEGGEPWLFKVEVGPDDKNSAKNIVRLSQTGLSLPNRDYYLKTDAATQAIRKAYVAYITKLFTLTGVDQTIANKQAEEILTLETAVAGSHVSPVDLRDPQKNYNKFTVVDFQKQTPNLELKPLLERMAVSSDAIIVSQPKYYEVLSELIKTQSLNVWKAKLKFRALSDAAPYLSKRFADARFDFYGKVLFGKQEQQERWKNIANQEEWGMGELLGRLYVERYFKPEAKQRMLTIVNNVQAAFKTRIEKSDWMSAETKKHALVKLAKMAKKIGYPDQWKNHDDLQISAANYYQNILSVRKHRYLSMARELNKPVNRADFGTAPSAVNAFYNASNNEIIFPAGILQPPFFDLEADDAINYGAIGMIIGHEMTHAFDDKNRQYDQAGNLKDWWTNEDARKFKTKAQVLVDQYNKYTVLNDVKVNGNLTLGENISDLGGLSIAYDAFKMTEQGKSAEKIDGFTADQRFFLSYAQAFKIKQRDELARLRANTDSHTPGVHRVNGPLSNMDAFYTAFNIKPGDKMYRSKVERAQVW